MTPSLLRGFACSVFALAVIAMGGAVMLGAAAGQSSSAHSSILNITEPDNGKDIDLPSGQTLQIKLKSNAGTGFAWSLSGDPTPLKLIKTYTQHNKNTSGRAGAPLTSVFQLQAASAGLSNVTLVYRRSWEYNVPPAKTFSVRVNVR